eukprot:Lithocolla_globosa_v1_NODE_4401_length_1445_cov_4.872662.p1 type:complete len:180 gc:universal NODE_4401_length_1445_cov_4.872662:5-544(+)
MHYHHMINTQYCLLDEYKDTEGPAACSVCHPNASSPMTSQSALDCVCDDGFVGDGVVNCSICQAGYYEDLPNNVCLECGKGFYSSLGNTECLSCDGNASTLSNTSTLASDCLCNAGYFGNGLECNICPIGTYQGQTGQISCLNCSAGFYQGTEGQLSCNECGFGFFSVSPSTESMPSLW